MNSLIHGLKIATLSGWLACATGYCLGFRVPQTWLIHFPEPPKPMKVETHIALESPPPAIQESPAEPTDTEVAPSTQISAPTPPPMPTIAAAQPLPEIPEIPAPTIRKVAARVAQPTPPSITSRPKSTSQPAPKPQLSATPPARAINLAFGIGAGKQPAPAYPLQSRRANQQGTVTIEFLVGTNGRVTSAWVAVPSPWPLLNNAALATVRSRWSFPAGSAHRYRIPIVFRLR